MSDKEIYDYVSEATPDYAATTLTVAAQRVVKERGLKNQIIHIGEDGSEERISLSNQSIFYVDVEWPVKSESDVGTIIDFYLDSSKGNGKARSFYWEHPTDGHTYVVRFDNDITRTISLGDFYGVPNVTFKVIGYKAD